MFPVCKSTAIYLAFGSPDYNWSLLGCNRVCKSVHCNIPAAGIKLCSMFYMPETGLIDLEKIKRYKCSICQNHVCIGLAKFEFNLVFGVKFAENQDNLYVIS